MRRKVIFSSIVFLLFQGFIFAQDDCDDCPTPTLEDQVCINTPYGAFPMPSKCIALCLGFSTDDIVDDANCDFSIDTTGWNWDTTGWNWDTTGWGNGWDWDTTGWNWDTTGWGNGWDWDTTGWNWDTTGWNCDTTGWGNGWGLDTIGWNWDTTGWSNGWDFDTTFIIDSFLCGCDTPTENDIVCVEIDGNEFPLPSECIALCLGVALDDIINCTDPFNDDDNDSSIQMNARPDEVVKIPEIMNNPSSDWISVKYEDAPIALKEISILNQNGQLVKQEAVTWNQDIFTINITDLEAGLYYIRMSDGKSVHAKTFVKL